MKKIGLYDPQYEHDACGVGFVGRLDGTREHRVIELALELLGNLSHRGASGADADSGDGAGIMLQIPADFFRRRLDFELPPPGHYGVGLVFLPPDDDKSERARSLINNQVAAEGLKIIGWRQTPVNPEALGRLAADSRPAVWQFFVSPQTSSPNCGQGEEELERLLYIARKSIENEARRVGFSPDELYVSSLSCRTIIYKGMMMAAQLAGFYPDLAEPDLASSLAVVHQRYSTNTFPSWRLAQPFRSLAHNGEINTIRGNRNWLTAREPNLESPLFGPAIKKLFPLIEPEASDSASLDNALECLLRGGRSPEQAMAMLIPQAWGEKYPMGPDLRSFFEYHAGLMEPWDGPAAVVFTDGHKVGAMLDRNGLRPARYSLLDDGLVVFASEAGALALPEERIVEKGALRPGQMLVAEIGRGRLIQDAEIKGRLARQRPYRRWVRENRVEIPGFFTSSDFSADTSAEQGPALGRVDDLAFRQALFGYDREDLDLILAPMAQSGHEPVGSMGYDAPLAVFSERPQSFFSYFRQQFAQITNPPIDSIRESLVMSLMSFIGCDPNILKEEPGQARLIKLQHPVLSNDDLMRLKALKDDDFQAKTIEAVFENPVINSPSGQNLARALARLEKQVDEAVEQGASILVISDKSADAQHPPIPSLLALAAVNGRLMACCQGVRIAVICQSGEVREVNHLAMLLSFGASAVNPWLAFDTVADLARKGAAGPLSPTGALENYIRANCQGLLKIMSKMGISTLRSYRGARIFEAVGLGPELMEKYFSTTASRVGGIGLDQLEQDALARLEAARDLIEPGKPRPSLLPVGGAYRYRRQGEGHLWTPDSITLLQQAVRQNDYELYRRYAGLINHQAEKAFTLRGLMDFVPGRPVPLAEVEPVEDIRRRFVTGAMSFGSLSKEAHETMALAMNAIGARSNSGEGGEDPARYQLRSGGRSLKSAIKQVASGRFGVTLEYLVNAGELQIKIAQGAKPGEGGQLPGHKVDSEIARVRHATAGVTLISPPPHHDIYSIEDIAQLIYDLYQVNDRARVSVKLVSEIGVGTIAAGAAKALAGTILISGFDGGTGAAPLSSIRHAGSPWEIGLAETQQTLVLNGLRGRVRLQADGQMKTGRDVVVASLLGADEFGFATAALVSLGCLMMRKCHTNGCPVGVATQDPRLRARFFGKAEHLINYFTFVAGEVREIMAGLGFRTMEEMTGQVERLAPGNNSDLYRRYGLDFSALLTPPAGGARRWLGPSAEVRPPAGSFDDRLLPEVEAALERGTGFKHEGPVRNTDRTIGARISSRIVRIKGSQGLPGDSIRLKLQGSAGQSFGAFAAQGLTLELAGEANDYVGKGLSGGRLIIRPPKNIHPDFDPAENNIIGNVALYGATSGELFLGGRAGERFAVRNSGALAVVEGVGDHGCEYMTGGRVAVLGLTGVNFAAGMSGGLAYVYDRDGLFDSRCNLEMVDLDLLESDDEDELRRMIERHAFYTESPAAARILSRWEREKGKFVKVFPMDYRRIREGLNQAGSAAPSGAPRAA